MILKRSKKKKRPTDLTLQTDFFVFDTETTSLSPQPKNFVFGVVYGWNHLRVIHSVEDFIKEFEKKMYKGKFVFAHNCEFDLLTIFGNVYKYCDSRAVFNGKFIAANYKGVKFADSVNILLAKLSKIGESLGMLKGENEKIFSEGLTKENVTQEDINYCIRDCEIVYTALLRVFEEIGKIKITLSSISLEDFRQNYLDHDIFYDDLVYDFYDSYYGGRTEVFKVGDVYSEVHDINSLYPFCMKDNLFPDISNLKKEVNPPLKLFNYFLKKYEGMAEVEVMHKDHYLGFLPFRKDNKLLFPVGRFKLHINLVELRFAIDAGIVEVIKCYSIVYANPVPSPFNNFVSDNYNKRLNSEDEFFKYFYKIKLNGLYGRFAMRKKYIDEYFEDVPFDIIDDLQRSNSYYSIKRFSVERDDCFLTTVNPANEVSFMAVPAWSSYITSYARLELLKGLLNNLGNGITYCDTDSIFSNDKFIGNISKDLGDWKKENKIVTEIRGLKNYSYLNLESGKEHDVIKGISKRAVKISKLFGVRWDVMSEPERIKNYEYDIRKYLKTKESLRRNKEAGESIIMTKILKNTYDKRVVLEDGETKAITL